MGLDLEVLARAYSKVYRRVKNGVFLGAFTLAAGTSTPFSAPVHEFFSMAPAPAVPSPKIESEPYVPLSVYSRENVEPVALEPGFRPVMSNDFKVNHYPHNPSRMHFKRAETKNIVIHWTEDNFAPKYVRNNHLAHYIVNRDGKIYRIVPHEYVAHHSGTKEKRDTTEKSLWNGETNLDRSTIGIEVVSRGPNGYTDAQWHSLRWLLNEVEDIYNLDDSDVLGHYEIAYPRGRKIDPACLPWRERLGIKVPLDGVGRRYDPDVLAGRAERSLKIDAMERYNLCSEKEFDGWLDNYLLPQPKLVEPVMQLRPFTLARRSPAPGSLSAVYR